MNLPFTPLIFSYDLLYSVRFFGLILNKVQITIGLHLVVIIKSDVLKAKIIVVRRIVVSLTIIGAGLGRTGTASLWKPSPLFA